MSISQQVKLGSRAKLRQLDDKEGPALSIDVCLRLSLASLLPRESHCPPCLAFAPLMRKRREQRFSITCIELIAEWDWWPGLPNGAAGVRLQEMHTAKRTYVKMQALLLCYPPAHCQAQRYHTLAFLLLTLTSQPPGGKETANVMASSCRRV